MPEFKLWKVDEDDLLENDFAALKALYADGWMVIGLSSHKSFQNVEDYRILLVKNPVQKIPREIVLTSASSTNPPS